MHFEGDGNVKDKRAATVLRIMRETFAMPQWTKGRRDPFETLIVTIISQNTADRNTARAFERLSNRFEIKPEVLANAETSSIEDNKTGFTDNSRKVSRLRSVHIGAAA